MRRPLVRAVLALVLGYAALNYAWMHAALAALSGPSACPAALSAQARADVAKLYGEALATPFLVCVDGPRAGLHVTHGSARFAIGLPSIVVLGPHGNNRDVAAHEVAHAELAERTSVLLRSLRVPTWFDEGLAMQLDHRPAYSLQALRRYVAQGERPRLAELSRSHDFFRPGRTGRANYAFARCVVGRWLAREGPNALRPLIERVGWTRPFPSAAFKRDEAVCLE